MSMKSYDEEVANYVVQISEIELKSRNLDPRREIVSLGGTLLMTPKGLPYP